MIRDQEETEADQPGADGAGEAPRARKALPAPGDGDFAAVTEIGADSGWLLAAASAPAGGHLLLSAASGQAHIVGQADG